MRYKQPRSLNFVSLIVWGVLILSLYGAVRFAPVYYRRYQARSVLSDIAHRVHRFGYRAEEVFGERFREDAINRVRAVGIDDPELDVQCQVIGEQLIVTAVYVERIVHPFIKRTTRLTLRPAAPIAIVVGSSGNEGEALAQPQ